MRIRITLLPLLALLALAVQAATAEAHRAFPRSDADMRAAWRYGTYPVEHQNVQWWFESDFPGARNGDSSYKRATRRAAQTWNALGRRFQFVGHGSQEVPYAAPYEQVRGRGEGRRRYCDATRGATGVPLSLVFWEPLPAPRPGFRTLAEAAVCRRAGDGRPHKFFSAVNRSLGSDWYRGESPNVPGAADAAGAKQDLQAVMTHEFGHASGWVPHYDGREEDDDRMGGARCGDTDPNRETMCALNTAGVPWGRTLGPHDRHTFRTAYGAP